MALLFLTAPALRAVEAEDDPDIEIASRLERGFQKLAKRIASCVVSLQVHTKPGNWMEELRRMSEQLGPLPPDRMFEGSGVIVEPTGLIITNEHVVHGADAIWVKLIDGRMFKADICGSDPRSDLAMIKLAGENVPQNLTCAVLADSDKVEVGQYAMAIGNPFGLANTLTVGVVSARGRSVPAHYRSGDVFYGNLLQTDAAINPGNSGGPLFDLRGKLIGINTMIFSRSGLSQGFGFAIPSNHLQKRLAYLKAGREIEYGWLGVRLNDLRPGQKVFKVPDNKGALVEEVIPNTPADRARLEAGMVIVNYEGNPIGNVQDLMAAVNDTPVGRTVRVKVVDRGGRAAEFSVRISKRYSEVVLASAPDLAPGTDDAGRADLDDEDMPPDARATGPGAGPRAKPGTETAKAPSEFVWRGMQVKELSADDGRKRGGRIEITRVRRGTPADRAGLYEGAIITELKDAGHAAVQKIGSLEEFKRVTDGVTGPAAIYIPMDGYITVEDK
ncbi:MAG: trypsin-like peptidase domain-containing protein [Planctomycetota bacterium]|nr:trypsin-like peptidase domain-containing protein [Planctomycetota bacterium]